MKKYKPEYLGRVIPADDPTQLTDFVTNKYDSFSEIYNLCKDESEKIDDIRTVESNGSDPTTLVVKVSTDKETIDNMSLKVKDNNIIKITGDQITASM